MSIVAFCSLTLPVLAHQVQVSERVGATLHIEPSDNPVAGEPARVWFALTRRGGEIITLDQCDCSLEIVALPLNEVIATPELEAIEAERYVGIPAANVTFPSRGLYQLELIGVPREPEMFEAFTLTFDVVVSR